jgi:hypothetical protein
VVIASGNRGQTRLEIIFRGEIHGPFLPLDAVFFVHQHSIPLNAAVRVEGQQRLWLLRQFPWLAKAAKLAASGKPLPQVPAVGQAFSDGADYTPNHLHPLERFAALFWACGLIGFSFSGLSEGEVPIVGGRGSGIYVGGAAKWMMIAGNLMLAAAALVAVVDHYDRRNNERQYRQVFGALGVGGVLALVLGLFMGADQARPSGRPAAPNSGAREAARFVSLPPAAGHHVSTVYVVATENCAPDVSLRVDRLAADLSARGIPVERVQDVSFPQVHAAQRDASANQRRRASRRTGRSARASPPCGSPP